MLLLIKEKKPISLKESLNKEILILNDQKNIGKLLKNEILMTVSSIASYRMDDALTSSVMYLG